MPSMERLSRPPSADFNSTHPAAPMLSLPPRLMVVTVWFSYNTSKHQQTTKHSMPNHRLAPLTNSTFGIVNQEHTFNDSAMALAPSGPMPFFSRLMLVTVLFSYNKKQQ